VLISIVGVLIVGGIILLIVLILRKKRKNEKRKNEQQLNEYNPKSQYIQFFRSPQMNSLREVSNESRNELESKYQIPFQKIEFQKELGEGSYGTIFLGKWNTAPVALKFCKNKGKIEDFMKEIKLMM
jgi:hypothetical protein